MKSIPKKYILFGLMDLRGVGLGEQICQKRCTLVVCTKEIRYMEGVSKIIRCDRKWSSDAEIIHNME